MVYNLVFYLLLLLFSSYSSSSYLQPLTLSHPLPLFAVPDHGVCSPGSLSAGASAGVPLQSAWADGETRSGVCDDGVDEQTAPVLWTVRGESQVREHLHVKFMKTLQ